MKKLILALLFLVAVGAFAGEPAHTDYEFIDGSVTDQVIGPTGGAGDVLEKLVVSIHTAATGTVSLKDGGGSAMAITAANTPIGVYSVLIGARSSSGAWKLTTGAGASVIAVGRFQ